MDTYDKQWGTNYGKIRDKIPEVWNSSGLDSSKRVSLEIQHQLMLPLAERTVYNYTLKGRNELYGKPFGEPGELGRCTYTWCKKIGEGWTAEIVPLTPEEEEIKQNLIRKYFGDVSEKQVIVKAMVESGEISKEEAWDVLEELTNMKGRGNFMAFMGELQEKLDCMVIRGTQTYTQIEDKGFDWEEQNMNLEEEFWNSFQKFLEGEDTGEVKVEDLIIRELVAMAVLEEEEEEEQN